MFNVLLDELPEQWNGYPIDSDFQTGILISQCLEDAELTMRERLFTALSLLFPDAKKRPTIREAEEALEWFMTGFNHDRHTKKSVKKVMDFDVDQWRIYAAFLNQYHINLNNTRMHWFVFMGLLGNLEECSFSSVIDIRQKEITGKMDREEKKRLSEAKKVYSLSNHDEPLTEEQKQIEADALEEFNALRR